MRLRYIPLAALAVGVLACSDPLSVQNTNSPDVERILSSPDGVEGLISTAFQGVHLATHGSTTSITSALQALSGESMATVANFGMAQRAAIPRQPIDNSLGNQTQAENERDFRELQKSAANTVTGIDALHALLESGATLGSAEANARAESFGLFALGVAYGNVALTYDQAAIATPGMEAGFVPDLVPYTEVMAAALSFIDEALAIASGTPFTVPSTWLRTEGNLSSAGYIQLLNSYKARFRAGVARTPAERDAANWTQIAAEAGAGITSDFVIILSSQSGWTFPWLNQALVNSTWSSMTPIYLGMADTSGNYRKWILPPLADLEAGARQAGGDPGNFFLWHTPDTRFPHGATRADQIANSLPRTADSPIDSIYFWVRPPGEDTEGQPYAESPYDFTRFVAYRQSSPTEAPWVLMSGTEIAMLAAEADMRLNPSNPALAVTLINNSRTANGLPAFAAGATRDTPAPNHPGGGGFSCVPQAPTGGNRVVECGSLWEAMKYEKRIETMFTGYAQWFVDHRGWGDLIQGTHVMYPVPNGEMDARRLESYSSTWPAALGTYSF